MGLTGETFMSGQVVLYFDDPADALRFALAAGSVMAGDTGQFNEDLIVETTRVTRIRLDAVNAGQVQNGQVQNGQVQTGQAQKTNSGRVA